MMDIFGIPVTADPDLEDGTILLRSDTEWQVPRTSPEQWAWPGERAIAAGVAKLRQLVEAGDPEIIEDSRSLSESADYVVRWGERSGPIDCERCRTPVVAVPEGPGTEDYRTRRYERAIWEPETWRKHTLRRCEAMRAGTAAS